jgi:hypothetical protein
MMVDYSKSNKSYSGTPNTAKHPSHRGRTMAINAKNRKKIGLPLAVCSVLDLHVRRFSDKELHRFFRRLGEGGVDYVRLFPYWPKENDLLPWQKNPSGKYDLCVFRKEYFDELRRVCEIAYQWQIGIYFDFFDQCGFRSYNDWKNPWAHNNNGLHGIYEYDAFSIELYQRWIKKVVETVGLHGYRNTRLGIKLKNKPNLFGLGNELNFRGQRKYLHRWAHYWGHGHAEYMRTLGYKQQILFSGEEKTAHALREFLSPWNNLESTCHGSWVKVRGRTTKHYVCGKCDKPCNVRPKMKFGFGDTVDVWHGFYRWPQLVEKRLYDHKNKVYKVTNNRWFGVSDDGVDVQDGYHARYNPPVEGLPENFKCAGTEQVIRACKGLKKWLNNNPGYAQWHHIEQLPRSVSEQSQSIEQLHQDRDVNIYRRIAKLWGVDITRKYSKWQLRRLKCLL